MLARFHLFVPVALVVVACRDSGPTAPPDRDSSRALRAAASALFNDPFTRELANRLHAPLPTQGVPSGGWFLNPQPPVGTFAADYAVDSAAFRFIIDVALSPRPESGIGR